ncbi:MAG: N-acetylmuramoyl-L-alanine amidase [Chitinophagaceae bacterium]|nr:N-acetylmuramoyl-L-alanine amidase [Chitinophagaceae bacterium]
MPANSLHTAIPLASLLALLKSEGFDISTSTLLDIQKVIANLDEDELRDFRELKAVLSPFICRNKEEQEHFIRVFDKYADAITPGFVIQSTKPLESISWRKISKIAAAILIPVLIGIAIYYWNDSKKIPPSVMLLVETFTGSEETYAVQNDSVIFRVQLNDTDNVRNYSVVIKIDDSVYKNTRTVKKSFPVPGVHKAMAWLLNSENDTLSRSIAPDLTVQCERTPTVNIQRQTVSQNTNSIRKTYTAEFTNPSADSAKYKFNWYINDSLFSTKKIFTNTYQSNKAYRISLLVQTGEAYCSTDSLTAYLSETPSYELAVTATRPLQLQENKNWKAILWVLLYALALPAGIASFVLYFKRRKNKEPFKTQPPPTQDYTGPYTIEFKTQNDKIATEKEISQMAEAMRKRHVGDVMLLNLRRTISNTIRSGGFPSLIFTPRTQPTDFLVLLDKGNSGGHQVQLFEYVLKKLQNEQVNITAYYFYKEPLLLSNEKLNHSMLTVDKVARLYPNTVLFIFSNTDAFFQTMGTKLKPWVNEKFKLWQHKIIVTPVPVNDWDYKETALLNEGFTVVPADLNAHQLIIGEINDLINREKFKKIPLPSAYSSRFVNFDEWSELKEYLGSDEELLQWVCALAVYPYVDWKVTVAIGKAIEENSSQQNHLVTYSNLLKISRIKWMQSGAQPDDLRLQMLQYLNSKTEIIARNTMVQLLEEAGTEITDSSLVKNEYELNKTVNRFLLHTQNPDANDLTDNEREQMKEYVRQEWLDYPLQNYLDHAKNTLLKNDKGVESITPQEYFKLKDVEQQKKISWQKNIRRIAAAIILLIGLYLLFQFFSNRSNYSRLQEYADIQFNLLSTDTAAVSGMNLSLFTDDTTYQGEKVSDSSIIMRNVLIDSTKPSVLVVNSGNGLNSIETSIRLNAAGYTLQLSPPLPPLPLMVRFNDQASYTGIADQLADALSRFSLSATQMDFTDSSRIVYYEQKQKGRADSIAMRLKTDLGINITTEFIEEIRTPESIPILFLNLRGNVCNPIAIDVLPNSLNEIWAGNSNAGFLAMDIEGKKFHYATNRGDYPVTYDIRNICLGNDGIYKIVSNALIRSPDNQQVFFIRNIQPNSFEFTSCPLGDKRVDQTPLNELKPCGDFVRMGYYYNKSSSDTIFLPVKSSVLTPRERSKLTTIAEQIKKAKDQSTLEVTVDIYENTNAYSIIRGQVAQILQKANIDFMQTIQKEYPAPSGLTEFDRNYFVINWKTSAGGMDLPFSVDNNLVNGKTVTQISGAKKGGVMSEIKTIVIHASMSNSLKSVIAFQTEASSQASEHIIIDRNGEITQLVPLNLAAYHAGQSTYNGERLNQTSIAISLINCGRVQKQGDYYLSLVDKAQLPANRVQAAYYKSDNAETYWEIYPPAQINALMELCKLLKENYNITAIIGHDEVDNSKLEPGPLFPMQKLRSDVFQDMKQQKN